MENEREREGVRESGRMGPVLVRGKLDPERRSAGGKASLYSPLCRCATQAFKVTLTPCSGTHTRTHAHTHTRTHAHTHTSTHTHKHTHTHTHTHGGCSL